MLCKLRKQSFPFLYTSPPLQPGGVHSHGGVVYAVSLTQWMLAESPQRGKEKQRGREEKINSHRHATLHQDCYCPEREKGRMERLL